MKILFAGLAALTSTIPLFAHDQTVTQVTCWNHDARNSQRLNAWIEAGVHTPNFLLGVVQESTRAGLKAPRSYELDGRTESRQFVLYEGKEFSLKINKASRARPGEFTSAVLRAKHLREGAALNVVCDLAPSEER